MKDIKKYTFLLLCLHVLILSSFAFCANHDITAIEPQILVVFGATGDLSHKKLFPALKELQIKHELPDAFACIGLGRTPLSNEEFRQNVLKNEDSLSNKIFYVQADINDDRDYEKLKATILYVEKQLQTNGNRVFYFATAASYFPTIIQKLKEHELVYDASQEHHKWSKIIIEKPFGSDYDSALKLKDLITEYLDESQVYLIDHYLGKEVIQNLLTFRLLNPAFESLWSREHIESVHITLSEDIGVGDRGVFWEETGLLRDLVQNHAMQMLSLITMDMPLFHSSEEIHHEKIKLLKAIRSFPLDNLDAHIIRGQYGPGIVNGISVCGYREEKNVPQDSNVETYASIRLNIDNPRWEGVPFFITAGKRMKEKRTEIVIRFKAADLSSASNELIFRVQPDEEIAFVFNSNIPGMDGMAGPVKMIFNYHAQFQKPIPDAYERLLHQCMLGDKKLFVSFEESLISWQLYTPVLEFWKTHPPHDFPNYAAGSNGP